MKTTKVKNKKQQSLRRLKNRGTKVFTKKEPANIVINQSKINIFQRKNKQLKKKMSILAFVNHQKILNQGINIMLRFQALKETNKKNIIIEH